MSQNLESLGKLMVKHLNVVERAAVLQDMGIINNINIHPKILKEAYQKLQNNMIITESSNTLECQFFDSIPESISLINQKYGPLLIEKLEQREGESKAEFEKRKKESEKEQKGKEENFVDMHSGETKYGNKPLAKAMRARDMSQQEVADAADVDKSTINRVLSGIRKPGFALIKKLSKLFGSIRNIFPELA
jgi:DNA-binding XRE family transcriptional regulator